MSERYNAYGDATYPGDRDHATADGVLKRYVEQIPDVDVPPFVFAKHVHDPDDCCFCVRLPEKMKGRCWMSPLPEPPKETTDE